MKAGPASRSPAVPSALAAALRDPRVVSLARTLRVDLQDPSTLNGLLARTRQVLEVVPTTVTLSAVAEGAPEPAPARVMPIQDAYVRSAIHAYEEVSKLGGL